MVLPTNRRCLEMALLAPLIWAADSLGEVPVRASLEARAFQPTFARLGDDAFDEVLQSLVMVRSAPEIDEKMLEVSEGSLREVLEDINNLEQQVAAMLDTGRSEDISDLDAEEPGTGCPDEEQVSGPLARRSANCMTGPVGAQAFIELAGLADDNSSLGDLDNGESALPNDSSPSSGQVMEKAAVPLLPTPPMQVNPGSDLETVTAVTTMTRTSTQTVTETFSTLSTMMPVGQVGDVLKAFSLDEQGMDFDIEEEEEEGENKQETRPTPATSLGSDAGGPALRLFNSTVTTTESIPPSATVQQANPAIVNHIHEETPEAVPESLISLAPSQPPSGSERRNFAGQVFRPSGFKTVVATGVGRSA